MSMLKPRRSGRRVRLSYVLIVLICAVVLSGAGVSTLEARAKIGKLPKDSVANHQIRTLDGRAYTLADLRGKVVVLDFFAIWCGHSKKHIPTLTRFGEQETQRGLQIIGLAVQDRESMPDKVTRFLGEYRIAYPVGQIKDSDFADFVDSRDVSVPQTLVYGRDGRLVAHFSGHDPGIDADLTATIRRELEK